MMMIVTMILFLSFFHSYNCEATLGYIQGSLGEGVQIYTALRYLGLECDDDDDDNDDYYVDDEEEDYEDYDDDDDDDDVFMTMILFFQATQGHLQIC